jgi:hypothetical protein
MGASFGVKNKKKGTYLERWYGTTLEEKEKYLFRQ